MNQVVVLPVLIPMLGAAMSLFVEHRRFGRKVQRSVAWIALGALALAVLALTAQVSGGRVQVYLLGDWPSHLGIALMADRLSAWMLLTTTLLAAGCLLYACAGWDRRAPHFHALFQFQLMGLNGAFLTGDIFNLFVFFEVLLIASYGLLLSGGRGLSMRIGMHYVVFNVAASSVFLIALGLIYSQLGTLNMAELAARIAHVPPPNLPLVKAAFGLLMVVFCGKAAMVPLYLWLPETYARAPAAVAALFAVMTKVGLYAMLRVGTLILGAEAASMNGYGRDWILWAGVATLLLAAFGVMAAHRVQVQVAYLVIVSAATLFVTFGLGDPANLGAGLYYLPHSTFAAGSLFLIADLIRRERGDDGAGPTRRIDRTWPSLMFLVAAISIAGLPPLSGFLGKIAILGAVPTEHAASVWTAILGSSLMVIMGLTRAGVRLFWHVPDAHGQDDFVLPPQRMPPKRAKTAATLLLVGYGLAMTIAAGPLMHYTDATARQLLSPGSYIEQVRAHAPTMRQP